MDWRRRQRREAFHELGAGLLALGGAGKLIYDNKPKKRDHQIDIDFRGQNKLRRGDQTFGQGATNRLRDHEPLPFANSQLNAQAIMSGSGSGGNGEGGMGSGNAAGLKETQIDDPYIVYRGPPDFTFCSLPWTQDELVDLQNFYTVDHTFRMTSVYDTYLETTPADLNVGLGQAQYQSWSDSQQRPAKWFDFYAGLYKYYHVVGCKYHVYVENYRQEPMWVYEMFANDTQPPPSASNRDMMHWKGVRYHYLDARGVAIDSAGNVITSGHYPSGINYENGPSGAANNQNYSSGNNIESRVSKSTCVFAGEYRPGDFNREIRLDSEVENWTLTSTNPALPEYLIIRVKPNHDAINLNDAVNYGDDLKYRIRVQLSYLVEFKELKDGLKWPVADQPLTVTINQTTTQIS